MRLVQVAKALGMTGQQLRRELETVDFGVKPTDREVPDNLAQGIARYIARKKGMDVDMSVFGIFDEEGEEGEGPVAEVQHEESPEKEEEKKPRVGKEIHVLRKLTLDDVSKEAAQKHSDTSKEGEVSTTLSKKEREEIAQEDNVAPPPKKSIDSQVQIKKKEGKVYIPSETTVKEFAEKAGVQIPSVIASLMKNGVMATINQSIDYDTAAIVAAELGIDVEREEGAAKAEDLLSRNLEELTKDEPENMSPRPPIVVVMGHVDHGKTAILDVIRKTDTLSQESGGITQHIGAYQIDHNGKKITFLDTPGHEAFTAMRARGAQITDIAVIVVSADEGIKDTTKEAIDHARDAGVPILVALNKIDLETSDPDRVKGELASCGLQPEEWGGDTPVVACSAKTSQGIDDLIEHILLLSELNEPKANPDRRAIATVIEGHLDASLGSLATVVVNTGTLKAGDALVCGEAVGKVRSMIDARGQRLTEAGPSQAVRVSGLQGVADVGDILQVVSSERAARALLKELTEHGKNQKKRSFVDLVSRLSEGKLAQLKIVLKADAQGSLEAIQEALKKHETDKVTVKVIHAAVGAVSESDVMMASASDAVVMAFHAMVSTNVLRTAEKERIEVREYDVIYKLLEDITNLLEGLLEPEEREVILGHLEVKGVFFTKKSEQVVGGRVLDGVIKRVKFRLLRNEEEVGDGRISSVKRVDKDIKEAKEGSECGLRVEASTPVEEGDVLEVFTMEFKKKKK
jgi:translation initiation factor IF-2